MFWSVLRRPRETFRKAVVDNCGRMDVDVTASDSGGAAYGRVFRPLPNSACEGSFPKGRIVVGPAPGRDEVGFGPYRLVSQRRLAWRRYRLRFRVAPCSLPKFRHPEGAELCATKLHC